MGYRVTELAVKGVDDPRLESMSVVEMKEEDGNYLEKGLAHKILPFFAVQVVRSTKMDPNLSF